MLMKILLTGGTGFIGKPLRKELYSLGHELFILTRAKKENSERLNFIYWDWHNPKDLTELVNEVDVVINLAGESIANEKWTKKQKEKILNSRINATKVLVNAINNATNKPKKFISASAIGIYGNGRDEKITEASPLGTGFLAGVCKEWERCAQEAKTNVVILRIGIVLGKNGGALKKIIPPFKVFLGGPLGSGNQWMSWITLQDIIGLIKFVLQNDSVTGILNATAPEPVTSKEFSDTLGKMINRPSYLPVPALILKILLGEMSCLMLEGQRVYPEKALQFGYKFKYPVLEAALRRITYERG